MRNILNLILLIVVLSLLMTCSIVYINKSDNANIDKTTEFDRDLDLSGDVDVKVDSLKTKKQ